MTPLKEILPKIPQVHKEIVSQVRKELAQNKGNFYQPTKNTFQKLVENKLISKDDKTTLDKIVDTLYSDLKPEQVSEKIEDIYNELSSNPNASATAIAIAAVAFSSRTAIGVESDRETSAADIIGSAIGAAALGALGVAAGFAAGTVPGAILGGAIGGAIGATAAGTAASAIFKPS